MTFAKDGLETENLVPRGLYMDLDLDIYGKTVLAPPFSRRFLQKTRGLCYEFRQRLGREHSLHLLRASCPLLIP